MEEQNEKQAIEEMAECMINIQHDFNEYCAKPCRECEMGGIVNCENHYKAERLYNAGYRKQSEGEWMVYGNVNNRRAMCTNCRKEFAVQKGMLQLQHFPRCPLCGARMRVAKMKGGAG